MSGLQTFLIIAAITYVVASVAWVTGSIIGFSLGTVSLLFY